MSAPEPRRQFETAARADAVAVPLAFAPAPQVTRWSRTRRAALFAAATCGFWALLLAPGGRVLA